jgi:NTP pyrophosphatase (non-canonical NTP hydrolase)
MILTNGRHHPHYLRFPKIYFGSLRKSGPRTRDGQRPFLWLIEEIGELATALNGKDRANLEEEFADVIAWLCTLANINDVDLAGAIAKKYLGRSGRRGINRGNPASCARPLNIERIARIFGWATPSFLCHGHSDELTLQNQRRTVGW